MYSEKPKNKRKSDTYRRNGRWVVAGLLLVMCVAALVAYFYPRLLTPKVNLSSVASVTIADRWSGLSPVAPIVANYSLTMQDGMLVGVGDFSITGDFPVTSTGNTTDSTDVQIPSDSVTIFLDALEQVELIRGDYIPFRDHTDDYPSIAMTFQTDHGKIVIYTSSQGENHVPWAATIRGETYVINSRIPMDAVNSISDYLHKDILNSMIDDYFNSGE